MIPHMGCRARSDAYDRVLADTTASTRGSEEPYAGGEARRVRLLISTVALTLAAFALLLPSNPDRGDTRAKAARWPENTVTSGDEHHPLTATSTCTTYLPLVMVPTHELEDDITRIDLDLPHPLAAASSSFCVWDSCSISPRLYHQATSDDRTLIGWTDDNGHGHVSVVSGTAIAQSFDYGGLALRGLATHGDGGFAVLLYDATSRTLWLSKRLADNGEAWSTNLNSAITEPDFWLGGSRLTYGGGQYAAYFTVQGTSGDYTGHYGDQLVYISDSGVIQSGGWDWGCSHSMAQLVDYHPGLDSFLSVCSSDCYPSKGILTQSSHVVYGGDGNCFGFGSAQLGQVAQGANSWRVAFSALEKPCCTGKGIGLAIVDSTYGANVVWLTDSLGEYERDPVLARLGTDPASDRYLVGWTTTDDGAYWLAVISGAGAFITAPRDVSGSGVAWGNRDDSLRTRPDGTASWLQGDPGSSTLHLFRFDGATYLP